MKNSNYIIRVLKNGKPISGITVKITATPLGVKTDDKGKVKYKEIAQITKDNGEISIKIKSLERYNLNLSVYLYRKDEVIKTAGNSFDITKQPLEFEIGEC